MKVDLQRYWALMCILPIGVGMEHRNKYVACLIGDELADDEEFGKLVCSKFEPHGGFIRVPPKSDLR